MCGLPLENEGFVVREPEHRPVREEGLLVRVFGVEPGGGVGEGRPCVQVGVEVDYGYGAVDFVQSAESGEGDGVVASECQELGCAAVCDGALLVGCGCGAVREAGVCLRHLPQREGVVEGRDGDVAAVDQGGPFAVWVETCAGIVAAERGLAG